MSIKQQDVVKMIIGQIWYNFSCNERANHQFPALSAYKLRLVDLCIFSLYIKGGRAKIQMTKVCICYFLAEKHLIFKVFVPSLIIHYWLWGVVTTNLKIICLGAKIRINICLAICIFAFTPFRKDGNINELAWGQTLPNWYSA
jgi:hypothetical protein